MDKSVFEKIADREIPGYIVWEDEDHIAFLTIEPATAGHTIVVPKKNIGNYLFALDDNAYTALLLAAKKVAKVLEEKLHPNRVLVAVEGFEVPHVHIKLVPVYENKELAAFKPRPASTEELQKIHTKITATS